MDERLKELLASSRDKNILLVTNTGAERKELIADIAAYGRKVWSNPEDALTFADVDLSGIVFPVTANYCVGYRFRADLIVFLGSYESDDTRVLQMKNRAGVAHHPIIIFFDQLI